ncbi:ribonuclease HII [bacterium BMS3Abin15]|nr:ribonuclease HII [bacterium BMS3Abin15]HDZ85204.1 ribonuclease HII [Candidatus Moranbacteria bacterium]
MIKSTFDLENKLRSGGYGLIIGIDEAGRGPLAGPVVACAAAVRKSEILNPEAGTEELNLVRDSKTLSEKQREKLFGFIMDNFHVGVGICDHETVDRVNILEASFLAMKKAFADLRRNRNKEFGTRKDDKIIIILDGNKKIPNFSMEQRAITGGDKYVKSISAASIIAKVTRDRMMKEMHEKYPEYNFAKHKGYGTKLHKEMIANHGPCEIHRRSFNLS